ncbi:C2H2-like zinc finger protein [Raphanus sativus]|uniref:Zinc finger protein ZAT1-like n=1 Tax=Raphanus sativus TaxID=3726 RepID=A0A6J0JPM2_RAPSA|nr:zinc finger protein ZAT1-like [Raphanus sativus]XP_056844780.1 zinc finger protein ZAT1-like [Raphanus sativus]KAJ4889757.1 C2H2-like zinc finger protein [Raphanus sativus]
MEKKHVCKFCNKKFPSGKSLGGHIRIHTNEYSVASVSFNAKNPRKNNKRLVDQREIEQQLCCRGCGGSNHMDCHCVGVKMVMMDTRSDTETTRSKKVMKQSESFSSSSASEIDQEHKDTALSLMMMSIDSKGRNLVVNSLAESSSENTSEILETKASSGEQLKMIFNQDLKTDKLAADDQLRPPDDSYSSDSDYFMNGPKKSDSDVSVEGSLRNTNRLKNGDDLGVKEGRSKYELRKSKRVLPCYDSDSCVDTDNKIHRSSDSKSPMVKKSSGANKSSKVHECPVCFRVFKSGQALGGHKRSHFIGHKIKHKAAADMPIDLNLPAQDIDE